jgi:hypothetical protein
MHHSSQFRPSSPPHLGQHPIAPEVLMETYLVVAGSPFPAEANPLIDHRFSAWLRLARDELENYYTTSHKI